MRKIQLFGSARKGGPEQLSTNACSDGWKFLLQNSKTEPLVDGFGRCGSRYAI